MAAALRVCTIVLCLAAAGCSFGVHQPPDAGRDAGCQEPPTHTGFEVTDQHGAVRVSYLDDPGGGFDFDGKHIVYASDVGALYLVDVDTQVERQIVPPCTPIPNLPSGERRRDPSIFGSAIAYRGWGPENPDGVDIYLFDIPSFVEQKLVLPNTLRYDPDFDDSKIVWDDQRHMKESGGNNVEIYLYDLKEQQESRITREAYQQGYPKISGRHLVWVDAAKGPYQEEIVLHDLQTGQSRPLTEDDTRQFGPEIDGDRVVWTDLRNGQVAWNGAYFNADIYLYDIATGELTRVTTEEHDQEYPTVHGRWIAWTDLRFGYRSSGGLPYQTVVFAYDIETGQERQVTFGQDRLFGDSHPRIWGDKLVYHSFATGGWGSLWMVDLTPYFAAGGK